jgi:hypothetical protein
LFTYLDKTAAELSRRPGRVVRGTARKTAVVGDWHSVAVTTQNPALDPIAVATAGSRRLQFRVVMDN